VGSFVTTCWQILDSLLAELVDSLLAELVDSLWADLLDNCRIVLWTRLDSLTSACVSSGEAEFFCSFRISVSLSGQPCRCPRCGQRIG
jgi:hypothetical protein